MSQIGQSTVRIDSAGRLLIPARLRRLAGIDPNSEVAVGVDEDGTVRVRSRARTVAATLDEARGSFRHLAGRGLVDDLIAERRDAAAREDDSAAP